MKIRKRLVFGTVIVFVAVGYGINKYHGNTTQDDNAVWVQASKVKQTTMQLDLHAIGALTARSVEVTPEVAGHVDQILFADGATVKQGDPLIQLDDGVYRAKNASAKAQLAYSQNNYKRMVLLGKQGAISRQAIDQADADLKEKKAAAEESEVMLNKMRLTAPFDGVVGKSKVNPGDYVTVGQSVVTVTDVNHLRIEYNLPERDLPSLKAGQAVTITTAAYPDKQFVGKLSFISPTINTANRSVSLYAEVKNDRHELAPGMFVDVMQSLGQQQKVMMVPERSLVPVLDGVQIYKIVEGKAYAVNVEIGRRLNGNVQVLHGLSPNDVIITDGQIKVKNGMPVKIKA
jgi:membrane fusion protein, multidrug efflux system